MRRALPWTVGLAALELTFAALAAPSLAHVLEHATAAVDDTMRMLVALVERGAALDTDLGGRLLLALAPLLVPVLLLEPWLTLLFHRAHADASERPPLRPWRRIGALLAARALLLLAASTSAALLAAFSWLVHVATVGLSDPRPHDLSLLALACAGTFGLVAALATNDRMQVHLALGEPRPVEALVLALHRPLAAVVFGRVLLAGLGVLAFVLEAALRDGVGATTSAVVLGTSTLVRLVARSLYVAFVTDHELRRTD